MYLKSLIILEKVSISLKKPSKIEASISLEMSSKSLVLLIKS
jgi:hypothetical protein